MTYKIIAVAALVIAIAALVFCIHLRREIVDLVISVADEINQLDKRMDNFADARMLERKEQRQKPKL